MHIRGTLSLPLSPPIVSTAPTQLVSAVAPLKSTTGSNAATEKEDLNFKWP